MRKTAFCISIILLICLSGCGKGSKTHGSPYSYVIPKVGDEIAYKLTYRTSDGAPAFPPTGIAPNRQDCTQRLILRCLKVNGNSFECGVIYRDIGRMAYKVIINYNTSALTDRIKVVDLNGKAISPDAYVYGLPIPFFCLPAFTKKEVDYPRIVSQPLPPDLTAEYNLIGAHYPPDFRYPQSELYMDIYRKNGSGKAITLYWRWEDWMWYKQKVGYSREVGPPLRYDVERE